MAAHYRVSGLFRNGLLEDRPLGAALADYLAHDRRFQVTIGACTWAARWSVAGPRATPGTGVAGAAGWRFLLAFGIGATLI